MKLLIFGECSSEALSGKYPYDVDIQSISTIKDGEKPNGISVASILAVKLEKLGHDISLFDFTKIIPDFRDRSIISRIKLRLFVKFFDQKVSNELFEAVSRDTPESMIVFKGLNIQPSTLKRIKDLGVKLINWNPDYFFNPKNTNKNLLESIEYYDLIVSGRKHLTEEYKQKGMKNILFLDWYYIPELHYPEKSKIKYDLTFVGNWSPFREKFMEGITVQMYIWGNGWHKCSNNFKKQHNVFPTTLSQKEMREVFSRSKHNLNILTKENKDLTNLRIFEVCACGGLLITERNEVTESYLIDREDCLFYSSVEEINEILASDYDLTKIAESGRRKIINNGHSFTEKVKELSEAIDAIV